MNGRVGVLAAAMSIAALGAVPRAEQLPIKIYSAADGLTYEVTRRIVADSHGFLWFCTQGALSRFDGYAFRNYGLADGLSSPSINDLLVTRHGVYWVATNGGGVDRLNDRSHPGVPRFTSLPVGATPQSNRVNVLFEDRHGTVWAGTDGGLFRFDPTRADAGFGQVPLEIPAPDGSGAGRLRDDRLVQVWAFAATDNGTLWIGTQYGLVQRHPDGHTSHRTLLGSASDVVHALLADPAGSVWIGHEAGLFRIDPTGTARRYTTADGLAHNEVRALYRSASGVLWIGTVRGLTALEGGQFRIFPRAQGLSHGLINAFAEDRAGNLWIGTDRGAMRWSRTGFVTYDETDGLPHEQLAAIFEDAVGQIYVVSPNWFISRFEAGRFAPVRPNLPGQLPGSLWRQARGVLRDRGGEWWIPAGDTIYRFAAVTDLGALARARPKAIYTTRDGLAGDDVRKMFEDSRGDIWIAQFAPARTPLTRWVRSTGRFERYSDAHGLPPFNAIMSFAEDAAGGVWMGLREGGMVRYGGGRFAVFDTSDNLPSGTVATLHVDGAGALWAGIAGPRGGVTRVANPADAAPRFERMRTLEAGGVTPSVAYITGDGTGRIYVGTNRGLTVLDTATGRTVEYTTSQGLAANAIGSGVRDRQGALWLGTSRGLSRFVPAPVSVASAPNVLIVGVAVSGNPVPISELGETQAAPIELAAMQNHVQIDYLGLSPETGQALRYQYRLDGGDPDWSPPTFTRSVTYAKLPPGRFRFTVRAVTGAGAVSPRPASIAFTIVPPVWQRWWFLALVSLVCGGAVLTGYRYRVRRLLALERVRTGIASDLHDDLGSTLSQIAILSEVAARRLGTERPGVAAPLARIADLSRESLDAMGDIVWAIDPRKDRVANLVQRMRRFASDVLAARDIEVHFRVSPDAERDLPLTAGMRREVFLIFKEAVKNIVRHSNCTRTTIELDIDAGLLVLRVADDGCGFDPSQHAEGHGLESLRRRAAALNGALKVTSGSSTGTHIALTVPYRERWGRRRPT